MAKPGKLKELERKLGDLEQVIPPLVNAGGQEYAARTLSVSEFTINRWLKVNGYTAKVQYVKGERGAA